MNLLCHHCAIIILEDLAPLWIFISSQSWVIDLKIKQRELSDSGRPIGKVPVDEANNLAVSLSHNHERIETLQSALVEGSQRLTRVVVVSCVVRADVFEDFGGPKCFD